MKMILAFVLPAIACLVLPVTQNKNREIETPLIANSIKSDISQYDSITYENVLKITPIPTNTFLPTLTPVITKIPQPSPISKSLQIQPAISKEEAISLIKGIFGLNADKAINIAKCESGLISNRISNVDKNPSSYGLFQIRALKNRGSIPQLLDAEYNIRLAYKISGKGEKWSIAWVNCSRKFGYD